MSQAFTESHRHLLLILFWVFESLLTGAVVTLFCVMDPHRISPLEEAAGLTFWFAFVGLFIVSFVLRNVCRRLANLGWISLFVGFWSLALFPSI